MNKCIIRIKGAEKLQEERPREENSIKHNVTKDEVIESFRQYLGEKNRELLASTSPKELEIFSSLLPKVEKEAYFIKGKQETINKFKSYFIARCIKERYEYATFMLKEYVEGLAEKRDSELFLAGSEKELLFLYLHGETSGVGNTNNWIGSNIIDRMVNRKRKGLITVILSEKDFPLIENSEEINVINLGGAQKTAQVEEAISNIKAKTINDNLEGKKSTSIYD